MEPFHLRFALSRRQRLAVELPPWLPAEGCQTFKHSRRLTPAEVAAIAGWANGGAPAGDPADAPAPVNPPGGLTQVDVTMSPAADYLPKAGVVDDYDGVFQRLRLVPGPHEIVIYHPGHRSLRQNIYYNPGSTHTIRHRLDPLLPGEPLEPQPIPRALPAPVSARARWSGTGGGTDTTPLASDTAGCET